MGFRPGLPMTVFVVLLLPVTLGLGIWQLDRAMVKSRQTEQLEQNQSRIVAPETAGIKATTLPAGTGIRFCAEFTGESWYLDNRTVDGKVGYDIYWPAEFCASETPLLVRRGWIIAPSERNRLPDTAKPPEKLEEVGEIRPWPAEPFLTATYERMAPQIWRIQSLRRSPDANWGPDRAAIVQLPEDSAWALTDDWSPSRLPPSRHVGYAIQWFGLATVLLTGFLIWGIRRSHQTTMKK